MKKLLAAGALALSLTLPGTAVTAATAFPAAGDAQTSDREAARPELGVEASKENVVLGSRVRFRGQARPRAAGERVLLQQKGLRKGARWRTQDTTRIGRRGGFRLADRPTTLNPRRYRVVKPATRKHPRTTSKRMRVTVYRWQSINQLDALKGYRMYPRRTVSIDGVEYSDARVAARWMAVSSVHWNIGGGCLRLRGRFGISDESDLRARARLELETDGITSYDRSFGLRESATATVGLRDVFLLTLRSTSSNPDSPEDGLGGVGTLAAAKVLCSF